MARYALADHVFVCLDGEHLVLLDLKEDRYWALEASQTAGLGSLVRGWPVTAADITESADSPSPETTAAIEVLQGRSLLTDAASPGKDATPVTAIVPQRELVSESEATPGRAGNWFTFFTAAAFAKVILRVWHFERVIRRVKRRKELRSQQAGPLDLERARKLVEAFAHFRVFLFSSKNECLLRFVGAHRIPGPIWGLS